MKKIKIEKLPPGFAIGYTPQGQSPLIDPADYFLPDPSLEPLLFSHESQPRRKVLVP